jgi:EAL domain-containing protein (putative c-di-GMP-specific phosphodiesterase class I)
VAVNLSMRNLHDPEIVDMIQELLTRWGVPAARLIVEITESSLMADAARAMEVLTRLRQMGVGISIDDFGTGYSSLAYLKRLPVDELKIDKSFVLHMAHDENDAAIVRSTIGLAHDLGLSVVAEGVEDEAAWELLTTLGCDVAQGYYVSRPLPASELTRWLASSRWNKGVPRAA